MKKSLVCVFLAVVIATAVIMVSGCTMVSKTDASIAASSKCQQKCITLLGTKVDFSNGLCLDDNIQPDWVCDIAHNPRQDVDNDPANQCPSFGTTAHHFVELNEDCRIIRVV